jgi:hypothetical protein
VVITWNVNNRPPPSSLIDLLSSEVPADFIVAGFQEVDVTATSFVFSETARAAEWERAVLNAANEVGAQFNKTYVKVRNLLEAPTDAAS